MKKVLNFLRKYWICFLMSGIMVAGISLSTHYADLYEIGSGMLRFDLMDLYLIYGIPTISFLHGCLSFAILKKMWVPLLIIYTVTCVYFFAVALIPSGEWDAWLNVLLFALIPTLFSLIGAQPALFVHTVVREFKEYKSRKCAQKT